ncbi:hypothetical protein KBX50_08290 [Micromonospora sp. C51]|uniref:hypothetical protein n=1 Tax=Micromonospora sp. C51 TaxID=2824879 RepID=UPI001B37073D|nr:hypothetical protein [Micromonospora sp. C51]MBQ1048463.1 hypothetical protein [Micromonospora sp. C51]
MRALTSNIRVAAGRCDGCGYVTALYGQPQTTPCGKCKGLVKLTHTTGTPGRTPCDDRCQYAIGNTCDCLCGGENHRVGYIAPPPWVIERDAQRHAEKLAKAEQEEAKRRKAAEHGRAELLAAYPILADLDDSRYAFMGEFADSMREAFRRGQMTPRQIEAACQLVERTRERDARDAQLQASRTVARAAGVRAPVGKTTFTGEIVKAKRKQVATRRRSSVDGNRTVIKVTVRGPEGWTVWGTLPRAAYPAQYTADSFDAWLRALPGQTITLTATVAPSDDPTHGFFDTPRLVAGPTAAPTPTQVPAPVGVPEPAQGPAPAPLPAQRDPWADLLAEAIKHPF